MNLTYLNRILIFVFLFSGLSSLAQFNGNYSIGSGGDYSSLSVALEIMKDEGMSGDVTFEIKNGLYSGQYVIDQTTTDSNYTLTIQSESGNPSDVTLYYSSSSDNDNFVFQFDSAKNVVIQNLGLWNQGAGSYATVIDLENTSSNILIKGNNITGKETSSASDGTALIYSYRTPHESIRIDSNYMRFGGYDIRFNANSDDHVISNLVIHNNTMKTDAKGVFIEHCDAALISKNYMEGYTGTAIEVEYCDSTVQLMGNRIYSYNNIYGLLIENCIGTDSTRVLVANNLVTVGTSSSAYGIYVSGSDYVNVWNNTVNNQSTHSTSTALYLTNSDSLSVLNNILASEHNGYAIYSSSSVSYSSPLDYNNLYSAGIYFAYFNNTKVYNLNELKALSGALENSFDIWPSFVAVEDLTIRTNWFVGKGSEEVTLDKDFDGNARNVGDQEMGARLFSGTTQAPYSGQYLISWNAADNDRDFESFEAAIDSLVRRGVDGPVRIKVKEGTYVEQIEMPSIPGASDVNRIIFESENQDSSEVTLQYDPNSTRNYVLYLKGTDFVTLQHLTFEASDDLTYGRLIQLGAAAENLVIQNCHLKGSGISNSSSNRAIIFGDDVSCDSLLIQNNYFEHGSNGVYIEGVSTDYAQGIQVLNNQFDGAYYGIYMRYHNTVFIEGNEMNNFNATGIYLRNVNNGYAVKGNQLRGSNSAGYGIDLYDCIGTGATFGEVFNNEVVLRYNAYEQHALRTKNGSFKKIYNNTFHIHGTGSNSSTLEIDGASNVEVLNNLLTSKGDVYAYYVGGANQVTFSDYNNIFSDGIDLAYYNGSAYQTLDAFKAAFNKDNNSMSFNPAYVNDTLIQAQAVAINNQGTVLGNVTTDITGAARDGSNPDIGAREFSTGLTPMRGYYEVGTNLDYPSLKSALNDLEIRGMDSSISFSLYEDTLFGAHVLNPVNKADDSMSISFFGYPAMDTTVLSYEGNSDTNYIIKLNGQEHVDFQGIKFHNSGTDYCVAVEFEGKNSDVFIADSWFYGTASTYASDAHSAIYAGDKAVLSDLQFIDLDIYGFSKGYSFVLNSNNYANEIGIWMNRIRTKHMGIDASYIDSLIFHGNYVYLNDGVAGTAVNLEYIGKHTQVYANGLWSTGVSTGIYVSQSSLSSGDEGLIANNVIGTGASNSSASNGIYLNHSDYFNIYHNSVNLLSSSGSDKVLYLNYSDHIDVKNNSFAINANAGNLLETFGYTVYQANGNDLTFDYNNYFADGTRFAYWNSDKEDLDAFAASSNGDLNSSTAHPRYSDWDNLTPNNDALKDAGTTIASVTYDLLEKQRDSLPDMGAFEFNVLGPLAGTYTVGEGKDFASIAVANQALKARGIDSNVVFKIDSGVYEGKEYFMEIFGVDQNDSIIFESASGNHDVVIADTTYYNSNWVVNIFGAKNMTFKNITFAANGDGNYERLVHFQTEKDARDINFIGCRFIGYETTSSSGNYTLVFADNHGYENIRFINNVFKNGSFGLGFFGSNKKDARNVVVKGNTFDVGNEGAYISYVQHLLVDSNFIKGQVSTPLTVAYGDTGIVISNNRLYVTQYGHGLYTYYCEGTTYSPVRVFNNIISCRGNGGNGIHTYYSDHVELLHNSVNMAASNTSYAYKTSYCDSSLVLNNIFALTSYDYSEVVWVDGGNSFKGFDYNAFWTKGTKIAWTDQTWHSIDEFAADLELAMANSIKADPHFVNDTNLVYRNGQYSEAGTAIRGITHDARGMVRDSLYPDLGAIEAICGDPVYHLTATDICEDDYITLIDSSTNVSSGTLYFWDYNNDGVIEDTTATTEYGASNFSLIDTFGSMTVKVFMQEVAGCRDSMEINLEVHPKPLLNAVFTNDTCGTGDASLVLSPSRGAAPYIFDWSNGASNTDSAIYDLKYGVYDVVVTDTFGCVDSIADTVTFAYPMTVTVYPSDAECGIENGSVSVYPYIANYFGDFTYQWTTGDSTNIVDSLGAGMYVVTIRDDRNCELQRIIPISNDQAPAITIDSIKNVNCYDEATGGIYISVSGGMPPYKYVWSNSEREQDIDNLPAGPYEVEVRDYNGCITNQSIEVETQEEITVSGEISKSACGGSTGAVDLTVEGGSTPYSFIWSNGSIDEDIDNLTSGMYNVTITDALGCVKTTGGAVGESGAPVVRLDSIVDRDCGGFGSINVTVFGGEGDYTYAWSTGDSIEDIQINTPGNYHLVVTDTNGCRGMINANVVNKAPNKDPICLVSVDSATGNNIVVWVPAKKQGIAHYNIYKESSATDVYFKVGEVDADSLTVFVDTFSNPVVRSWKYRLSTTDTCGNESGMTDPHKTLHLTASLGIQNSVQLNWDDYEGFTYGTYVIRRYTKKDGWETLAALPSYLHSYTDANAPLNDAHLWYIVQVVRPGGACSPFRAKNYNSAKSNSSDNMANDNSTSIFDPEDKIVDVQIAPNPTSGLLNVYFENKNIETVAVEVYNLAGQLLLKETYSDIIVDDVLNISEFPSGLYQIKIQSDSYTYHQKIVKE